jgi:hypothetical protein
VKSRTTKSQFPHEKIKRGKPNEQREINSLEKITTGNFPRIFVKIPERIEIY